MHMGNEGVHELTKILVGGSYRKTNIENSNDPPAVVVRRRARANYGAGKSISMFARAHGERRPDNSIFDQQRHYRAIAALDERTDTTGFKETNEAAHEAARERSQENRDRVDDFNERESQGEVVDNADEPEDQEWAERTQEPVTSNSRGRTKPTGLMEVNAAYAARHKAQIS